MVIFDFVNKNRKKIFASINFFVNIIVFLTSTAFVCLSVSETFFFNY